MNQIKKNGRKLNRNEMKKITGGNSLKAQCVAFACESDDECPIWNCYCNLTIQTCKPR